MDPVSFAEMGDVQGLFEPDERAIEEADVASCPVRGEESVGRKGQRSAECALLSAQAGRSVGVTLRVCRICRCHGKADAEANPYLQKHIVQLAFSGTVARAEAVDPLRPSDAALETAVANVKRFRGGEIARRFVDSLYAYGSVDAEKAVELIERHELEEAGRG